jgi:hypothetical protein
MAGTLPTLSLIDAWDTQHLEAAADHWTSRARAWEDAYTAVYRETPIPGGIPWEGRAADAALRHVGADRLHVVGAADMLHHVAVIARSGAAEVNFAKRQAVNAVEAAQAHGFHVGEDLSVTDQLGPAPRRVRAVREYQGHTFAATIRTAAAELAATDTEVGSRITTAAKGLNEVRFPDNRNLLQAADFKQNPPPRSRRSTDTG